MAHTVRGDLNLLRALLLNGDDGIAGQWPVSTAGGAMDWWATSDLISEDADNIIELDGSNKLKALQALTTLSYDSGSHLLSFVDEAGDTTTIDLGALTTDIYVTGASLSGDTLILTDNDGGTANVTVDLSAFRGILTDGGNGTFSYDDGSGSSTTIDMRLGVSTDSGNDLEVGADGLPFLEETVTGLSLASGALAYQREDGGEDTVGLISTDANNRLTYGASNDALYVPQIRSVATFNATTDWGSASGGLYTLTISAATFANAHANAMYQVQAGSSAPFETAIGLHSAKLNADGSVTLQVCATPDGRTAGRVVYVA